MVQHEFNCQQQHPHLCIMNQSEPSLLFIRALPRYATAANVRLRTVGEKRPVIAYLQMAVFNKESVTLSFSTQ